ncbi:hypothetical protein Tco_1507501, partial [Tanacetum coccineum]
VTQSNQFVPQAVLLRSGQVSIPAAKPNQVPAGRPKPVSIGRPKPISTGVLVFTGKQNRPPPGRRNSSLVTSGWWQSTARPMTHLLSHTSSYFQTYTPYLPHMYYNHMQYGGVRWATAVKPSENSYTDAEDERIFDSGCSRSMAGNMERLDDFQEFQGGKVTFGGGEDESMVVLRVPRKHNLYTINLNNLSPRVKNPVFHQRTKHIEIRQHFIRDANDKKLIQVLKIHTDDNVADLLTKAFDGPRFTHLVVNIGMLNP